jgi:small subunit ribosomal protein S3
MSRREGDRDGRVPLHTLRADIDFGIAESHTTYGVIGVKVWVYRGDILPAGREPAAGTVTGRPATGRPPARPGLAMGAGPVPAAAPVGTVTPAPTAAPSAPSAAVPAAEAPVVSEVSAPRPRAPRAPRSSAAAGPPATPAPEATPTTPDSASPPSTPPNGEA